VATQTPSATTRTSCNGWGFRKRWFGAVRWTRGDSLPRFARRPSSRDGLRGSMDRPPRRPSGGGEGSCDSDRELPSGSCGAGEAAIFCVAGAGPRPTRYSVRSFARHFGFLPRERLAELYADAISLSFPRRPRPAASWRSRRWRPAPGDRGGSGRHPEASCRDHGTRSSPATRRIRHGDSIAGKGSGKAGSDGTGGSRLRAGQGLVSGTGPTRGALPEG
jgi:hypothetical protein